MSASIEDDIGSIDEEKSKIQESTNELLNDKQKLVEKQKEHLANIEKLQDKLEEINTQMSDLETKIVQIELIISEIEHEKTEIENEKTEIESQLRKLIEISLELEEKLGEEKIKLMDDIRTKEEKLTQNKQIILNKNDLKLQLDNMKEGLKRNIQKIGSLTNLCKETGKTQHDSLLKLGGIENEISKTKDFINNISDKDNMVQELIKGSDIKLNLLGEFKNNKELVVNSLNENLNIASEQLQLFNGILQENTLIKVAKELEKQNFDGLIDEAFKQINTLIEKIGIEDNLLKIFDSELGQEILKIVALIISIAEDIMTIAKNVQQCITLGLEIAKLLAEFFSLAAKIASLVASAFWSFGASLCALPALLVRIAYVSFQLFTKGKQLYESGKTVIETTIHLFDFQNKKLDADKAKEFLKGKINQGVNKVLDLGKEKAKEIFNKNEATKNSQTRANEINQKSNEINQNNGMINNITENMSNLGSKLKSGINDIQSFVNKINNETQNMMGLKNMSQMLNIQVNDKNSVMNSLNQEGKNVGSKINTLKEKIFTLNDQKNIAISSKQENDTKININNKKMDDFNKEILQNDSFIKDKANEISSLKENITNVNKELKKNQGLKQSYMQDIQKADSKIYDKNNEIANIQNKLKDLNDEKKAVIKEIEKEEAGLKECKDKIDVIDKQVEKNKLSMENLNAKKSELKKALKNMKDNNKVEKKENQRNK